MSRPFDELIRIARQTVGIGSELLYDRRPQVVTEKFDRDTYTDVDVSIERKIRKHLEAITPEIGFTGEEEGGINPAQEDLFWALDPIDGTSNFVHQIPLYAVQICLIKQGEPIVAAIDSPVLGVQYWAAIGHGAFANERQIFASRVDDLSKAMVSIGDYATGTNAAPKNRRRIAVTTKLAAQVERVRMIGSAALDLAWVAEGKLDGTVILSNSFLDIAAGALIASEAGATVLDTNRNHYSTHSPDIVAATRGISEKLLHLVTEVAP
ncbi:inositol monophosphatase family protein [Actinosynnema sp. NPDC002837]